MKSRHDDMAKLLGVPAMPFDIMYPEKAIEFKRTVLDYIKVLRRAHQDISQGDVVDVVNGIERNTLKVDATGFPLAPRPQSWTKVTRADVEPIFRLYMTRHYRK
jgi:hypothetical protein